MGDGGGTAAVSRAPQRGLAPLLGRCQQGSGAAAVRLLSNILETFNQQFGNIPWSDRDRVHRLITEDIPARVAADPRYQNARKNSDRQNAKIEHDEALKRVMTAVLRDDTELFKQFMDNDGFRRWMTDTVFGLTYSARPSA